MTDLEAARSGSLRYNALRFHMDSLLWLPPFACARRKFGPPNRCLCKLSNNGHVSHPEQKAPAGIQLFVPSVCKQGSVRNI